MQKFYKAVRELEDGTLVSMMPRDVEILVSYGKPVLTYNVGGVTCAPDGRFGVFLFTDLDDAKGLTNEYCHHDDGIIYEAEPIGEPREHYTSNRPTFPAILLGKEVWRQKPLPPKEKPKKLALKTKRVAEKVSLSLGGDDPLAWMGVKLSPELRRKIMMMWNNASEEDKQRGMAEWNNASDEKKQEMLSQLEAMPDMEMGG